MQTNSGLSRHLIGHEAVRQALALRHSREGLPHAILLSGPRGIGKATLAFHLAYTVFTNRWDTFGTIPEDDPVHRRIVAQSHGDLLVLERARDKDGKLPREINIQEARRVTDFLSRTSLEGGWRIVIIDSIDDMNRQSMNAILKSLEEPPSRCLFILICHQAGRLLPTILSRCQRFVLSPLGSDTIRQILSQPGISGIDEQGLELILEMAEGSAGRAINLIRHGAPVLHKRILSVLEDLVLRQDWKNVMSLIRDSVPSGKDPQREEKFFVLGDILVWILGQLVLESLNPASAQPVLPILKAHPIPYWIEAREKVQELFQETGRLSLDPFQVMMNVFQMISGRA